MFGPLLFLTYIKDIHNSSAKFSLLLFADDTNLLYADTNLKSLEKPSIANCSKSPTGFVFVFIYLPHDYNNYKKIPKKM